MKIKQITLKNQFVGENIILKLKDSFSTWKFKDMGTSKIHPNSSHFHLKSGQKDKTGVLEITFGGDLKNDMILKVANNRKGNWSIEAMNQIQKNVGR